MPKPIIFINEDPASAAPLAVEAMSPAAEAAWPAVLATDEAVLAMDFPAPVIALIGAVKGVIILPRKLFFGGSTAG